MQEFVVVGRKYEWSVCRSAKKNVIFQTTTENNFETCLDGQVHSPQQRNKGRNQ